DDVKRWCVCVFRISQFVYDMGELCNAAWPTVSQDQRNGIFAGGSAVQEMDSQTVNGRTKLADLVEARFERSPVVPGAPVVHDIDQVGKRNALCPPLRAGRGAIHRLSLW